MSTTKAAPIACQSWCEGPPACEPGEHYGALLTVAASAGRSDETWPPQVSTRVMLLDEDDAPRVVLFVEEAGQCGSEAEVHLTRDEARALIANLSARGDGGEGPTGL